MTSPKEDLAHIQVQSIEIQGKSVVVSKERLKIVKRASEGWRILTGKIITCLLRQSSSRRGKYD